MDHSFQWTHEPALKILGPFFLLSAVAVAAFSGQMNFSLVGVGLLGLFFCAKWEIRGFGYSLALLLALSFANHFFLPGSHLAKLAFEGSIGFALLLTALGFEEGSIQNRALLEQIGAKDQTIENLEEDFAKKQEEFSKIAILANEKEASLLKLVEDLQAEFSSLQILNDVLRQQTKKLSLERDLAADGALDAHLQTGQLRIEFDLLSQELARIQNESDLKLQNEELFKELNQARVREEQTRLINETLTYIHAKESSELEELRAEKTGLAESLQIKEGEISALQERCEHLFSQGSSSKELLFKLEGEKEFFKDRFEKLKPELETKEAKILSLQESLSLMEQKLAENSDIEALHRQLRAQFQDKDAQLKQARAERFKAETEAETLRYLLQEMETEPEPFSKELKIALDKAEEEAHLLAEENKALEEIVTTLSVKKKNLNDQVGDQLDLIS